MRKSDFYIQPSRPDRTESVIPMVAPGPTQANVYRYLDVLIRYAGVGITGTAVHYVFLLLLVSVAGPVAASTMGAIAGCIVNFHLARTWVFGDRVVHALAFRRFVSVAAVGVAVNGLLMTLLTPMLPLIAAQLVATATVFLVTFALNDNWSFSERRS